MIAHDARPATVDDFMDRPMSSHEAYDEFPDDRTASPTGEMRHGVTNLARDVITLAELQAELLKVDLQNWTTKSIVPAIVLMVVAGVAALASLPLLLLSAAYALVEYANLTEASAMLAAAGIGILIAVIAGALGYAALRRGRGAFDRFRVELTRNISWLKQVLARPSATADQFDAPAVRRPPR